ncbi:MAG: M6 family metalloprotease domain-containing protein [Chitinispirillaceae bacterium]|nr:M6 family metalloprotease domain-containing protein [Chitinispirillaceae bacterium]
MTTYTFSAPYYGESFELEQPDGSKVPVIVWGDEFYQRVESPDGYTLIRNNETGWICYAELSADSSELVPTDRLYQPATGLQKAIGTSTGNLNQHVRISRNARLARHRTIRKQLLGEEATSEENGIQSAPSAATAAAPPATSSLERNRPVTGELTGLTILIDFSDETGSIAIDSIRDFVNKLDYTGFRNNGSVRDFYLDVSGGKVDYQNIVVGYYRAKNPKTYYDSRSASFGTRAQELIKEALAWLQNDGFDFSTLSTISSSSFGSTRKTVQAINVLYAGSPTQGWSQGLWPHQGRMNNVAVGGDAYASVYQMTNIGTQLRLGTFCHENGHMLFSWPDLYDYGGESGGVGVFCLMCNTGTTNPVPPCCYLRDYSGWDVVTDITDMLQGTVLTQLPDNTNNSFVYRHPSNDRERFYIEARRKSGRYATLPDTGFLIWHVDQDGSNDDEQRTANQHYLVSLEQADNLFELEGNRNSGRRGDLFRAGYADRFDDNTGPDAHWWNGSNSGLKIFNMSDVDDTMSFSIGEIATTVYTITASCGENGVLNPSGKISVPTGANLRFVAIPDSGYQIDAVTIDDAVAVLSDTINISAITADHTLRVVFGLKGALRVVTPEAGAVFFAGDTTKITWRSQGVTLSGIAASFSTNGGKSFTPIGTTLPPTDTALIWIVPVVESDSCVVKLADTDANPTAQSGMFSIRKKPAMTILTNQLAVTIDSGTTQQQPFAVTNSGTGDLTLTATTKGQLDKILINELWLGADATAPDGIELLNAGPDMDLSGWQIVWDDNKSSSGTFTFPEGFVLKSGSTYTIVDQSNDSTANSKYMGINAVWQYSDSLQVAVTLLDAMGRGVDFVKTSGIPILPPDGTTWSGNGVPLCASVQRNGVANHNSASDWICSETATFKARNESQQLPPTPPLISATPHKATTIGGTSSNLTLTLDASTVVAGIYTDTLIVYHNDPSKPSPVLVPCVITVTAPSKVVATRKRFEQESPAPRFIAAPNPVRSGELLHFEYHPRGDEQSGELSIYNRVGDRIAAQPVDFSRVNALTRKPVQFTWSPQNGNGSALTKGTCIARLVVKHAGGSREMFSAKIGVR